MAKGKLLKTVLVTAPALLLLAAGGLMLAACTRTAVPENYTATTGTGGSIESRYLAMGGSPVAATTRQGSATTRQFCIYYPQDMAANSRKYPVVVMLNGTGTLPRMYPALFRHLASWGFIVIGSDDDSSGFGTSADETMDFIYRENADAGSPFHGRMDTANIGIAGHSQGGAGVFTAISVMRHKDSYKAAVALSPAHEKAAHNLGWKYDLSRIGTPVLMLAGTRGLFEKKAVIPREAMLQMYGKIPGTKAMARRIGADHGEMLYAADGYVTAWFMYHLQQDSHAAGMLTEIRQNALYRDQQKHAQHPGHT